MPSAADANGTAGLGKLARLGGRRPPPLRTAEMGQHFLDFLSDASWFFFKKVFYL